jgi:hypothetical protein
MIATYEGIDIPCGPYALPVLPAAAKFRFLYSLTKHALRYGFICDKIGSFQVYESSVISR